MNTHQNGFMSTHRIGLALVKPEPWEHRFIQASKMFNMFDEVNFGGMSWGDYAVDLERREDAPYLKMSVKQFEKAKEEAKHSKKFSSWNNWLAWATRLEKLRADEVEFKNMQKERAEKAAVLEMTPEEFYQFKQEAKKNERFNNWDEWLAWATKFEKLRADNENKKRVAELNALFDERQEYIEFPWLNFGDVEEQKDAIEWVEDRIRSLKGGEMRLAATKRKEIKEKRTEIVNSLKLYITVLKIQKMIRSFKSAQSKEIEDMLNECFNAQDIFNDMEDMGDNRFDTVNW
jgi:hypothetical protein